MVLGIGLGAAFVGDLTGANGFPGDLVAGRHLHACEQHVLQIRHGLGLARRGAGGQRGDGEQLGGRAAGDASGLHERSPAVGIYLQRHTGCASCRYPTQETHLDAGQMKKSPMGPVHSPRRGGAPPPDQAASASSFQQHLVAQGGRAEQAAVFAAELRRTFVAHRMRSQRYGVIPVSINRRASCSRRCFWYCSGLMAVACLK